MIHTDKYVNIQANTHTHIHKYWTTEMCSIVSCAEKSCSLAAWLLFRLAITIFVGYLFIRLILLYLQFTRSIKHIYIYFSFIFSSFFRMPNLCFNLFLLLSFYFQRKMVLFRYGTYGIESFDGTTGRRKWVVEFRFLEKKSRNMWGNVEENARNARDRELGLGS